MGGAAPRGPGGGPPHHTPRVIFPPPAPPSKTSLRVPLPRRVKMYIDASQASPKVRSTPVSAGGNLLGRVDMRRFFRHGPAGHGGARSPLRTPRRRGDRDSGAPRNA